MSEIKGIDESNDRLSRGRRISLVGLVLNVILAAVKIIAGAVSGMISVMADGINNLSDAVSGIVNLVGFKLAGEGADDEHPFGHGRYEYISGLVVAFLVMIAGVELLRSGIEKIVNPTKPDLAIPTLAILVISIGVKAFMAFLYLKTYKKIASESMKAAAEDSRNDALSTLAIFITAVIYKAFAVNLDGFMATAVSIFIIVSGIGLIKETINPLLGKTPEPALVEKIEKKVLSYEGVLGTHDLMVHDYGPGRIFASVHVEVPAERNVLECHEIIDKIEQDFKEDLGIDLVIHYDPIVLNDERTDSVRGFLKAEVKKIDASLSVHDVRCVPGDNNTNVIFDLVVPSSCALSEEEVKRQVQERLSGHFANHTAVIKIDHSFVSLHK